MDIYKKLYLQLFNDITNIIHSSSTDTEDIINRLCLAQCNAEELFLELCEEYYPDNSDLE